MKVIIAGGRSYTFTRNDIILLNKLRDELPIIEVVSGKASGADRCGEQWAKFYNIPVKEFPANWGDFSEPCIIKFRQNGERYNALAGPKRNLQMAQYADALIAFPGSRGTQNMIDQARKLNLKVIIV